VATHRAYWQRALPVFTYCVATRPKAAIPLSICLLLGDSLRLVTSNPLSMYYCQTTHTAYWQRALSVFTHFVATLGPSGSHPSQYLRIALRLIKPSDNQPCQYIPIVWRFIRPIDNKRSVCLLCGDSIQPGDYEALPFARTCGTVYCLVVTCNTH
jgi:hypothetical protein